MRECEEELKQKKQTHVPETQQEKKPKKEHWEEDQNLGQYREKERQK